MKFGYVMLLVAVGAMLVFAPVAMAAKGGGDKAGKGHSDKNAIYGTVKSFENGSLVVTTKDKTDKTIATNDKTTVVIGPKGDQAGTLKDVAAGAHVAVTLTADSTPEKSTADKIVVMPPREKKAK